MTAATCTSGSPAARSVRPSDKHFRTYKIDDLFRAKVVTKLIDDEGVKIKQLSSIAGQCRL